MGLGADERFSQGSTDYFKVGNLLANGGDLPGYEVLAGLGHDFEASRSGLMHCRWCRLWRRGSRSENGDIEFLLVMFCPFRRVVS